MALSRRLALAAPILALTGLMGWAVAEFREPTRSDRTAAVGSLTGLTPELRRAFRESTHFEAKKPPGPGDWLAQHEEAGQTYRQFVSSGPNFPDAYRRKLYILPLGEFDEKAPSLEVLAEVMSAYYTPLQVAFLPPIPAGQVPAATRERGAPNRRQWKSTDLLQWLPRKLPRDAYAMIAVTMTDLYPDENWNFVFGQASIRRRVGIFSFARYHPSWHGEEADEKSERLVLQRAAKVLTHEMGHMFGILHCVHYECNMNGANHLRECDNTPMHLCPVCLRKLQRAIGFDPTARYQRLGKLYREHGFGEEADWVAKRREWIKQGTGN